MVRLLRLFECNYLYFIAIAFIAFTLHEIKQCPVSFGTPGSASHVPVKVSSASINVAIFSLTKASGPVARRDSSFFRYAKPSFSWSNLKHFKEIIQDLKYRSED